MKRKETLGFWNMIQKVYIGKSHTSHHINPLSPSLVSTERGWMLIDSPHDTFCHNLVKLPDFYTCIVDRSHMHNIEIDKFFEFYLKKKN